MAYDYLPGLGGVATCAAELSRALAELPGVQVRVLAPRSSDPGRDFAVDSRFRFFTRRVALPLRPELALPRLAWAVRREARDWNPHFVLDTLWWPGSLATSLALACSPRNHARQAVLVHGVEVLESRSNSRKRLRARLAGVKRHLFRRFHLVLPVSRYTADLVREHCGVAPARLGEFRNGVNTELFRPGPSALPRERYANAKERILLTVARLEDYKGVDVAIRAVARLRDRGVRCRYLVGGVGPDQPRLTGLVRELGVGDRVTFLGKVPAHELADLYRLCDLFVLLPRIDLRTPNVEGFGLVYLEAAACGKPSLGPNVGGPVDAIEHGQTGVLVDPEDPAAAADAIAELLGSPTRLAELGANALDRARTRFTWGAVAASLLERMAQECAG